MISDTTLVFGLNKNKEIQYIKSFNHEAERPEMMSAYTHVSETYPIYCMGDIARLKGMVEDYFE